MLSFRRSCRKNTEFHAGIVMKILTNTNMLLTKTLESKTDVRHIVKKKTYG